MQLQGWSEEDEKQFNEVIGDSVEEPEIVIDDPVEEKETPVEETPEPENPVEKVVEQPVDSQGWAKLRFEAAEAKRKADALEAENERLKNPPTPIPSKEEDIAGHLIAKLGVTEKDLQDIKAWKEQQETENRNKIIISGAIQEFTQHENAFKQSVSDYDPVAEHLKGRISDSIRMLNPYLSEGDVNAATTKEILRRASIADRDGINPAKALYEQGKASGYVPAQDNEPEKSNLSIIANNKKKSTNMLGTGGSGKPEKTLQSVANAPQSELQKLSPEELDRLIFGT